MKVFWFCPLLICLIFGCSKSGSGVTPDMTMAAEMVAEDPEVPEEDASDGDEDTAKLVGEFQDGAHPTSGTAVVNVARTELNLTNFRSDDGPILELYISTDLEATDYITLGELQGLEGDFTYPLPPDVNFVTHRYVMVWCVDFSVSFGHALLE